MNYVKILYFLKDFDIASMANAHMQSYSLTRIFHDARHLLLQQQQNDAILVIDQD